MYTIYDAIMYSYMRFVCDLLGIGSILKSTGIPTKHNAHVDYNISCIPILKIIVEKLLMCIGNLTGSNFKQHSLN